MFNGLNGIAAYGVEVEVNCGYCEIFIAIFSLCLLGW